MHNIVLQLVSIYLFPWLHVLYDLSPINNARYYSMCSLAVSTQDSPAVEPRSNPGSGKILMSENLRLYTTSPVVMC